MFIEIEGLRIGGRNSDLIITDYASPDLSVESSDITIPGRDGLYAGQDRRVERSHVFTIRTGPSIRSLGAAQELADQIAQVWAKTASMKHGETMPLIIETTRRRRIFGRPRKITTLTPDVRAMQGSVEFILEFLQTDPVAYADEDEKFSISVLPESQGGIIAPLIAPIKTATWVGSEYRFVTNKGDTDTAMTVKFYGPCSNPSLEVDGQVVGLKKNLAYDETVTVNGRAGTVTNEAGANVSRYLTARSRLDALRLSPGQHEVRYKAEDTSMTAHAEIIYASAYNIV